MNNIPHLGNIIGCVLSADVFARYCRLRGYETLYICGTDEYGTATEIKALEENKTPKQICDKYHELHRKIYEWFNIKFDSFGRTSTPKHTEIVQEIFLKLYNNGYIAEDEVEQLYDEKAKLFLADRYIEGTCPFCGYAAARGDQCDKCGKLLQPTELINPLSKVSGTKPVLKKTKHLFIDLPKMQDRVEAWIETRSKEGSWSQNSIEISKSWLKEGLRKRAITRDLKWGIPVPLKGYEDKVFYVWFDAPIGYISITANHTDKWEEWWLNNDEVQLFQFLGKDNVPFHTVIFPATLMGTEDPWTFLYHISTTEFLNYEHGKFSKSRGIGVFGDGAMESGVPADVWRYYLLINRPENADTVFSWKDFGEKTNSELIGNVGNLINRTVVFIARSFNGEVKPVWEYSAEDTVLMEKQQKLIAHVAELLEKTKFRPALQLISGEYAGNANKYFQDMKPWELVKTDKARAEQVMAVLATQCKDMAILLEPFLPQTAASIFEQLNVPAADMKWSSLGKPFSGKIGTPQILFKKIEDAQLEELKKKFSGKQEVTATAADFDLEIGQIVEVKRHPDAEKLYVEQIKLGDGTKQIVSGLANYFTEAELLNKKVVVVRNLMPAKLRGVESQGMVLAVEEGGKLELLSDDSWAVGAKATAKGLHPKPKEVLTIKEFGKVPFDVKDGEVLLDGRPLLVGNLHVRTKTVGNGKVC